MIFTALECTSSRTSSEIENLKAVAKTKELGGKRKKITNSEIPRKILNVQSCVDSKETHSCILHWRLRNSASRATYQE